MDDVCRITCTVDSDCPAIPMDDVSGGTVFCSSDGLCEPSWVVQRDSDSGWFIPSNVAPPTINYVAPSRAQICGLCYYHSKFQTFQTRYAIEMDRSGWYGWTVDQLDRSILMTPVPFYECAGQYGDSQNFMDTAGLVDHCIDPYGAPTHAPAKFQPDTCGYYSRYMTLGPPWSAACNPVQQQQSTVLTFRSAGWLEPRERIGGDLTVLASWVAAHGPVECGMDGSGTQPRHAVSIIGFDFTSPTLHLCYQNSWADDDDFRSVKCLPESTFYAEWGQIVDCTYPLGFEPPAPFDPVSLWPFDQWISMADNDKNADGIPDDSVGDGDGDGSLDEFDCGPHNPYQAIDTDGDLLCEPRKTGPDIIDSVEVCEQWCESLYLLEGLTGTPEGGGQGCADRCQDWDKCITSGIKNIGNEPPLDHCNWRCLSAKGRWINGATVICDPPPNAELGDCCEPDELQNLEGTCPDRYFNVSYVDSDEYNPGVSDPEQIADVCEGGASTRPVISLDTISTVEPLVTDGGIQISVGSLCRESRAKIEAGFFGGNVWLSIGTTRARLSHHQPLTRISEIGACGCSSGSWATCESWSCPEDRDNMGILQAWQDIVSLQCEQFPDFDPNYNWPPQYTTSCGDKVSTHARDEDCSDAVCDLHEFYWRWRDHTGVSPGDIIKVRVGIRDLSEPWQQNVLFPSLNPVLLPATATTCTQISDISPTENLELDTWHQVVPFEPPQLQLGEHLGSQALGRDMVSKELYLFEFDKKMRGPLNPRRLTYAADQTPRIEQGGFVSVAARVKSSLFGFAGNGTQAMFVFGRRMIADPGPGDASEIDPGEEPGGEVPLHVAELWIAGLGNGLDTIHRAGDLLGESRHKPPPMARPAAVYDRAMSRLVVAGGGESGRFGVWAYTPRIGQWHEISTPLPADLEGATMVYDRARYRLYLLGGRSGGVDQNRMVVIDLVRNAATELAPMPAALTRSNHAASMDPINRLLYVFGGRQGRLVKGDLWQLDLRSRVWTQLDDGTDPTGPGARERAQMLYERRYGRLWISGGRDDTGFKLPTLWGFATAQNVWEERPLAPDRSLDGQQISGIFSPDSPVMWEVDVDETIAYPGQLFRLALTSDDPCIGLQVWDSAGERVAASRHCDAGERATALLGQPGERYVVELVALDGFALGVPSNYDVRIDEATLVPAGSHSVGPASSRPVALAGASSATEPLAMVLLDQELVSIGLHDVANPQTLDALDLSQGSATGLSIWLSTAHVSMDSPGGADLLQAVSLDDPASMALADAIDLPGQAGHLVAVWQGRRAYAAKAGKLEIVDLTDLAGPRHVGSVNVGGQITCLTVHGDRLYVCTMAGRLKVFTIDRQAGEQLELERSLNAIGQTVRVHGTTVHVGELERKAYQACRAGGPCNTGGHVEVFRFDETGTLVSAGGYSMSVLSLPHLELSGSGALRIADGGLDVYRVEATP